MPLLTQQARRLIVGGVYKLLDSTVKNLSSISAPREFKKGSYICHEGEIGNEMYIVITGSIGIYIGDMLDEAQEVARIAPGGLFGEMAMVDNMPRSASCVALEDTLCVSVSRENLRKLITGCPEVAENLLLSLSARIRDMDNRLYKSRCSDEVGKEVAFIIPAEHHGHQLQEPPRGTGKYFDMVPTTCPVCNKRIVIEHVRQFDLKLKKILPNQRRISSDLDMLWHTLSACPECGYANFSTDFFALGSFLRGDYLRAVTEQTRVIKMRASDNTSPFDRLAFQYYRTIHITERFNQKACLRLGKLWLYLSWLYGDAEDAFMADYTQKQAIEQYLEAYDNRDRYLPTDSARQQCAIILAELYRATAERESARKYYLETVSYQGTRLSQVAYDRMYSLREGNL